MTQTILHDPVNRGRMEEAERLLRRYPDVDDQETERLVRFMKEAPALEVALLTCKDHLKRPYAAFRHDQRRHFEMDWGRVALATFAFCAVIAAVAAWYLLG
jgi:hypothetical protein